MSNEQRRDGMTVFEYAALAVASIGVVGGLGALYYLAQQV